MGGLATLTEGEAAVPESGPVLVRGISRSGTTLLTTLLDAHSHLAMSYELYPKYMVDGEGKAFPLAEYQQAVELLSHGGKLENQRLRTFIRNCGRGGLKLEDLLQLFSPGNFGDRKLERIEDRLNLIADCALRKMQKAGKPRWGVKIGGDFGAYHALWPTCHYLYIVRDARDVLASQLHIGNFRPDPAMLAREWSGKYRRFQEQASIAGVSTTLIRYEDLVDEPTAMLKMVCEAVGLSFESRMLEFHRQALTIYKTPHLSREALSRPVNRSSIGRWKSELGGSAVQQLVAVAGDAMRELGYL